MNDSKTTTATPPMASHTAPPAGSDLILWCVKIERTICVLAKDRRQAEDVAKDHERDELYNDCDGIFAREITDMNRVPIDWADSLPYTPPGVLTDKTVSELFEQDDDQNNGAQGSPRYPAATGSLSDSK